MKLLAAAAFAVLASAGLAIAGEQNRGETGGLSACDLQGQGVTIASTDNGCVQVSGGFSYRAVWASVPDGHRHRDGNAPDEGKN